jgi:hypothetical protein
MLHSKSKKIALPLCLCAISVLSTPIALAASGTGDVAAMRAAEQKAALAKKAAEREAKKAETEAKKATGTQEQKNTTETPAPVEEQKEK